MRKVFKDQLAEAEWSQTDFNPATLILTPKRLEICLAAGIASIRANAKLHPLAFHGGYTLLGNSPKAKEAYSAWHKAYTAILTRKERVKAAPA